MTACQNPREEIAPTLPATFFVKCQFGEVILAATDELAHSYRRQGKIALDPSFTETLATIERAFPGARVVEIRRLDADPIEQVRECPALAPQPTAKFTTPNTQQLGLW